jgi:hypothetical protein
MRRLTRRAGGSLVGTAALGMLGVSATPAGAATQMATYRRDDNFAVAAPNGTHTCAIHGQVDTYDDDTINVGVWILKVGGPDGPACGEGSILIEVTYDPDPSDPATSTFTVAGNRTSEVNARRVLAPNFIKSEHTVHWRFDIDDPVQTAGPYRLPQAK